jgi:ADP-heptose:LPS heptosyltransferase
VRRVLVAHNLLAGDTLMLTALLAKLRQRFPAAELVMTVSRGILPLYATRPYGVNAVVFDPRSEELPAAAGFDLALVPGDNRYSWLAAALGARWIVAFAGDRPAAKSWMVDELVPYPAQPAAWSDMCTRLVAGEFSAAYKPADWPAPPCAPFTRPEGRYAVLHVEASTPLKHWREASWLRLAEELEKRGSKPIWSAGRDGETYLDRIDPQARYERLGHQLDLAQVWHLVSGAALLVCVDTSVAHMGKLVFTPTVTLFGPSSAELFGKGEFWRDAPFHAVTVPAFPCRDQRTLFKRRIEWIRRCQRTPAECAEPRCMNAIGLAEVLRAIP